MITTSILRLSNIRKLASVQIAKQAYTVLSPQALPSIPISVKVSPEEVALRRLNWKNLEIATRAIHRDGLVVLESIIDHAKLDLLNERMLEDAKTLQARKEASPYNYNKGNIQQDPPMAKRFFDPSIIMNPIATQVTASVLGPKPRLSFISGNSALPPTEDSPPQSQPVHSDADFDHPENPFALVVNVPLVEMTKENGSTEVWLGTHLISSLKSQDGSHGERASGRIKDKYLAERRETRPPSQPTVAKGSIVIRDLRLWHAGKPNYTQHPRIMLAMINFAPWFRNTLEIEFSEDLKPNLECEGKDLQIQAKFVTEQALMDGYLNRPFGNSYDFDQQDKVERLFEESDISQR